MEARLLLVHVEVCIWVLKITQMWALLEVAKVVSTVGVRAVCAEAILTLETPHREVIGYLAHGQIVRTLLAVGAEN